MNASTLTPDTLISARWIIPVIPENTVLENHTLAIQKGKIIDLFPSSELSSKGYESAEHTQLGEHILIPGLINCHGHAAMSLLRGYADDLALMDWLENHIWPAETKWVNEDFVYDGSLIAIGEMIKSGTTCFSDMYFYPDQTARASVQAGIRCQLSFPIFEFPSNWGEGPNDYFNKGLEVRDNYRSHNLINVIFGPHAPYTVSNASFEKVAMLAEELDCPIQLHLHETEYEVQESIKEHGLRPIERLHKIGILTPSTQCVHMTALNNQDIEILQQTKSHVIHCPESNMKLASGFCPVNDLLRNGINVALGTDSAASNDDLDLLSELKTAALLGKAVAHDPSALDGHTALRMATINGAKALGIAGLVGSIEVGKQADLCAVRVDKLDAAPLYSPVSSLIYTNSGSRVDHVWVNGKALLESGELTTLHETELFEKARSWGEKIINT